MMNDYIENVVDKVIGADQDYDEWDLKELNVSIRGTVTMAVITEEDVKDMSQKELKHMLKERAAKAYEAKERNFRSRSISVRSSGWFFEGDRRQMMDHIDDMDQLRQGIGIQAYGQRDPKVVYKKLGYDMFDAMTRVFRKIPYAPCSA